MDSLDILLDENIEPFDGELREFGHNAAHV